MGTSGTIRNANQSRVMDRLQHTAARMFDHSPRLAARVRNAGEVADYIAWTRRTFGRLDLLSSREALWRRMATEVDGEWCGCEFGVAWGYATDWWLRNSGVREWHGFDRFTGLPRSWHGEQEGAYSTGGRTPNVLDPRVRWHVGDVEDTLPALDLPTDGRRVVLFDLDIYEPTAFAWRHLEPRLRAGDLVYFDEAMASDERRVLDELVLPSGDFDYVGSTPLALALRLR